MSLSILASNRDQKRPRPPQRERAEQRIIVLAKKVKQLTAENIYYLDRAEMRNLVKALSKAKQILIGEGDSLPPSPPRPLPAPPRRIVCANESPQQFQQAFRKIKNFAYAGDGFDYQTEAARVFALEWTEKYYCDDVSKYIRDAKRLKKFSYSGTGLDMDANSAVVFSKNKVDRFCSEFSLEKKFERHYQFAYSSGGLDMDISSAREYALLKVEPQAFSCRPYKK